MTKTRQATLMLTTLLLTALTVFAVGALLQRSFIYYQRRYPAAVVQRALSRGVTAIEFQTSQGKQVAFLYRTVASDRPPRRLWLMFGGNAMLALDWLACRSARCCFTPLTTSGHYAAFSTGRPHPR